MGSKALVVLVMFLATILLISAEVASRENDEKFDERDGKLATDGVDESKYFGGYGYGPWGGGYGPGRGGFGPWGGGYGPGGGGYGPWGGGFRPGFCGPFGCKKA